jgi:hypothetical protein
MAKSAGMTVLELKRYYKSSYFSFCFPLFVIWRLWTVLAVACRAKDMCETFSMALRRDGLVPERF